MEVLSFLADLCTIVTAMVAVVLFIYRFFKQENKNSFNRGLSFFLFVSIVVLFIGSSSLLLLMIDADNINKKYLWIGCVCLLLSVVSFGFYARRAYVSLDKNSIDNILPPGMFWQMFFNKIPARVVNVDSNNISFAVVKMDDCDEVNKAAKIIEQSYENKQKYCIKVRDGFKRKGKGKYEFNLNKIQEDKELSGVVFLIGRSADYDDQIKLISKVIDEFSNVRKEIPIGYAQCGNNVSFSLHYEEITEHQLSECIHHLIMRGYIRSKMQFDLGNAYHRSCILLSFLLIASLFGVYWFATKVDNRYIRPRELPNAVYSFEPNEDTTYNHVWDSVAIPFIIQDSLALAKILDNVTNYYFRDLNSFKGVKVWLKDINDNDTLFHCVYSDMAKKSFSFSRIIPNSYCAGQVAKHRLFFLWPGVIGDSSFFLKKTKVVWTYHGDNDDRKHDTLVSLGVLDLDPNKLSWSGEICDDNGIRKKVELHWCDSNKVPDEELAAFFFSYDGCLVLEIDCFTGERITSDYDYMSHLMFRNSVRKYVNFVYYLLQQDKYKISSKNN